VVCRSTPLLVVVGPWRSLSSSSSVLEGWVGQCDVARVRGPLCTHLVGIPLLGCPGVALRAPDPSRHPHILFRRGGGDWACVGRIALASVVTIRILPKLQ
jgi:hypothetical protein